MALSCRKARWLPALAAATCAAAAPAPPAAAPATAPAAGPLPSLQPGQQPITVDAASSEVDYRSNTVVFSQVVISQGATRVAADHARATGLEFANSRWTFTGHVRIDAEERGSLRADEAVVDFRDNRIARATVTGKPAEFEQQRTDSPQIAHGHADEIVYDVTDGTVRLSNEAWLSDGQNQISGPLLVYNIRAQRVEANAAPGGERVHITITPRSLPAGKPEAGKGAPEPARPAPSPQS